MILTLLGCPAKPPCTTAVSVEAGEAPGTAIVSWEGDVAGAVLAFGVGTPDRTIAGAVSPVEIPFLASGEDWVFELRGEQDGTTCEVQQATLHLPPAPPEFPALTEVIPSTAAVDAPLLGYNLFGATTGAVVLDRHGRYTWWLLPGEGERFDRVRFDDDGVWALVHPANGQGTPMLRQHGWNGELLQSIAVEGAHHDFYVTEEGVTWLSFEDRDVDGERIIGDTLRERLWDGTEQVLWNAFDEWEVVPNIGWEQSTYEGAADWTHANTLEYDADEDGWLVSLHHIPAVVLIDRAGVRQWTFGEGPGVAGDFTFADGVPDLMHSAVRSPQGLLMFENGGPDERRSHPTEFTVDWSSRAASRAWEGDPAFEAYVYLLGDAERVGTDTVLSWGGLGVISEVNAAGETTWQLNFPLGHVAGFLSLVEAPWAPL